MTNCNSIVDNNYRSHLKSEYERLGLYADDQGVCTNSSGVDTSTTSKSNCTGTDTWTSYGDMMLEYSIINRNMYNRSQAYPKKIVGNKHVPIIPQIQNAAIMKHASSIASDNCKSPCMPNRIGSGKYYGSAANCKNDGTQGSCYMYSYPNPQTPTNPNAPVGSNTRRFARNFIPTKANANGLRLLFNNNKFSLTNSANGRVGTTAGASRAINRGRASARNAARVSYNNRK